MHTRPDQPVTEDILQREIAYSFACIEKVKKNESVWNYLRGMTNKYPSIRPAVTERCSELIAMDAYHNNYLAVGYVADLK